VFAALDPETSSAVFTALFGNEGLLRGKTVVLATNQRKFCALDRLFNIAYIMWFNFSVAQVKHSDWIIALHGTDETQQGTYAEFLASNNTTGRLIRDNVQHPGSGDQILAVERSTTEASQALEKTDTPELEEMEPLEASSHSTSRKIYLHYMRSVGWHRMTVYALLLLVAIAIQVVTPVFLQIWSTFNDTHSDREARNRTGIFLGSYAIFEVFYSISITVLFYYVIMAVTLRASANLHAG
jgi:hypothetical protein